MRATPIVSLAVILLSVRPSAGQQDPATIRNFLRVNDQFCTGGQPRPEHFDTLKHEGVKAVINLRTPAEHRAEEEESAALIHCASAVRVGAFWMIRRVLRDGWTPSDAEAEAQKIGFKESPDFRKFVLEYIESHR